MIINVIQPAGHVLGFVATLFTVTAVTAAVALAVSCCFTAASARLLLLLLVQERQLVVTLIAVVAWKASAGQSEGGELHCEVLHAF